MSQLFARIDTIFLTVSNLERSTDWYVKHLGFQVRWQMEEAGYTALDIGSGETPLTLARAAEGVEVRTSGHCVFNLFAADLQRAHESLTAGGVDVDPIQRDESVEWFEFRDPDGHILGVCHFDS